MTRAKQYAVLCGRLLTFIKILSLCTYCIHLTNLFFFPSTLCFGNLSTSLHAPRLSSFLYTALYFGIVSVYYYLFICLFISICFQVFFTITNDVAVIDPLPASRCTYGRVMEIAGSKSICTFRFNTYCQTAIQNTCGSLPFHQEYRKRPIAPLPLQHCY